MRWKVPAGVLLALSLLIPATSAAAETGSSGPDKTICQTIMYADVRELVTIDLDTASDTEVRVLASQILAAAVADSLAILPGQIRARLDGTPDDLRAFLRTDLQSAWSVDLRIAVVRTLSNAGPNVDAAAQETLKNGTIDAYLAYLNHSLCIARAFDYGALKVYADVRELVTIDLDTASDTEVRVLASQILAAAVADSLAILPGQIRARLDGTPDDLRAFLRTDLQSAWSVDLRIAVVRTLSNAGPNVDAAAQETLRNGTIDAYLAYLNYGLYVARALDSGSQPAAPVSV